jgi:deoxyribodipyrimidine photo-lyase
LGIPVVPIFIFDTNILDKLEDKNDRRVTFIYEALLDLQMELVKVGSTLEVYYGDPLNIFSQLLSRYNVSSVFTNNDYEPYAIKRDNNIKAILKQKAIPFHSYKDQVIFEKDEVVKEDGRPYTVFTPYSRKWKVKLSAFYIQSYPTERYYSNFFRQPERAIPTLNALGFQKATDHFPGKEVPQHLIKEYAHHRDFPAENATSRVSVHLRFGTISIRQLATRANQLSPVYLDELIWREFYQCILWHFPRVDGHSFKPEYDNIQWRNNEAEFARWCSGTTGYPIVDAGMRELNATGFMHNRVRMIVASFLIKHLLTDWRWGEAYFAEQLIDYELASNNGGWQWAAGSGCDAAPYFRIFNPYLQTKKFDKDLMYIRKWVPEFEEFNYPAPVVEHEFARKRCLEVYSRDLKR